MYSKLKISKSLKLLSLVFLIAACSTEDDQISEENFFKADVEGERFEVNDFSGIISGEKRVSSIGTVDLAVKAESLEGKSIEFLILNYNGKNRYSVGEGFFNENWIKYSQDSPVRSWGASRSSGLSSDQINSIEICCNSGVQKIIGCNACLEAVISYIRNIASNAGL